MNDFKSTSSRRFLILTIMAEVCETTFDKESKIWSCPIVQHGPPSDSSIGKIILDNLRKLPGKIIQICDDDKLKLTSNELIKMGISVAKHFQKIGLKQEDVIGVIARNSHYLTPLLFGAILDGISISTLDPSFDKNGIKHIFGITKPKIMFCDEDVEHVVQDAFQEMHLNCKIISMNTKNLSPFFLNTDEIEGYIPPTLKNGDDHTIAIMCSSGSTGLPKAVCVSNKSLKSFSISNFICSDDIIFCFSSLYWISGLWTLITGLLKGATRIVTTKTFSPKCFLELVQEYQVSLVLCTPSQMALIVNDDNICANRLDSIKFFFCGGSPVPLSTTSRMNSFLNNCRVLVAYGMTELGGLCSMNYGDNVRDRSVGKLVIDVQIKIIDNDNSDFNLGVGDRGEICIRKKNKWSGYFNDLKTTNEIYDSDGWIHSGDIGYMDKDGFLFICDRIKDILKYNNFHYYPTEIEDLILTMAGVIETCVFGVPDIFCTHLPAAAVVKRSDCNLTESDILKYVESKMVHFKHLKGGVYFCKELPKTVSGKVIRRDVFTLIKSLISEQHSNTYENIFDLCN